MKGFPSQHMATLPSLLLGISEWLNHSALDHWLRFTFRPVMESVKERICFNCIPRQKKFIRHSCISISGSDIIETFLSHTMYWLSFSSLQLKMGVSSKSVSTDDFFKTNLVNNLAALLGIDKSKIRVMDVISAGGARRRRAAGDLAFVNVWNFTFIFTSHMVHWKHTLSFQQFL